MTGLRRLMCDADHDCGHDVWTGWWPGYRDCERLGFMNAPGWRDFTRLYTEAFWSPEHRAWITPPTDPTP